MKVLEELRKQFPEVSEIQMKTDGYCLWLIWDGECNPILIQTLEDYGGVCTAKAEGQSLWFFFTTDIFLAAARLAVWARFNSLTVSMQLFSAHFRVGAGNERMLIFNESLWAQRLSVTESLSIWIHESVFMASSGIPGVSQKLAPPLPGMAAGEWKTLEADPRLPYQSSFSWYAILQPVGNPLDKNFQKGWREIFSHIESLLQRNKFRFTLSNYWLIFHLDGLQEFKTWCREFLKLMERLKEEKAEDYWPCVQAIIDRRGLNFNADLPKKVGVDWGQLSPDFPCMAMRNALILGDEFCSHQARFAAEHQSPDDWCYVTLLAEEESHSSNMPQLLPHNLVLGSHKQCFYCGQRSHPTHECPTRVMPAKSESIWKEIATLSFASMEQGVQLLDGRISADPPEDILYIVEEQNLAGTLARGLYDIDWYLQLRSVGTMWRLRGRDMRKALSEVLPQEDDSPLWNLLHNFSTWDIAELDKELQSLSHRFPKDFRVPSLRGFVALERGDFARASAYWKEAELYSTFPVIQTWHTLLQGRLYEYQQLFSQALMEYDDCLRILPDWQYVLYRKLVCKVKLGFSEEASDDVENIINKNSNYFNKMLLDPELERGSIHIFTCLNNLWQKSESSVVDEERALLRLQDELSNWFMPGNSFAQLIAQRIQSLLELKNYKNFVAYQSIGYGRLRLENELQKHIRKEAREYKEQFTAFVERLQIIHNESLWFPFPTLLKEFNRSYNQSVINLNWAIKNTFQTTEAFKTAQRLIEEEGERLKNLENKMRFLRIIRDTTLFVLSFVEKFFWIEAIGSIFVFILLPLLLVYGDKIGLEFASLYLAKNRWQMQKTIFILITLLALAIAGLRTIIGFDAIKAKIFAKAKAISEQEVQERKAQKIQKKNLGPKKKK